MVVRAFSAISREISILIACDFVTSSCEDKVIALRKAATSTNFDLTSFQQLTADSPLIGEIMVTRDELDAKLVEALTQTITQSRSLKASFTNAKNKIWGVSHQRED